jgi:ketosteroid isomerase-like protein
MNVTRYILALAVAAAAAVPSAAQIHELTPTDPNSARRAYNAAVQAEFTRMMMDWRNAWNADHAADMTRFYTQDAALLLAAMDAPVRGHQQIAQVLSEALPGVGDINTGVEDFRVAGDLAYGLGRYHISGTNGASDRSGTYMVVLENRSRRWLIRSQLFRPDQTVASGGTTEPQADAQP